MAISTLECFIELKPQFKMVLLVDIGEYMKLEQIRALRKKKTSQECAKMILYPWCQKIRKERKRK